MCILNVLGAYINSQVKKSDSQIHAHSVDHVLQTLLVYFQDITARESPHFRNRILSCVTDILEAVSLRVTPLFRVH